MILLSFQRRTPHSPNSPYHAGTVAMAVLPCLDTADLDSLLHITPSNFEPGWRPRHRLLPGNVHDLHHCLQAKGDAEHDRRMRLAMTTWSQMDVLEDGCVDERGTARDLDRHANHTSPKLHLQLGLCEGGPPSSPTANHRVRRGKRVNEPTRLIRASACPKYAQDEGDHRTRGPLYLVFFAMQHQWPLPR